MEFTDFFKMSGLLTAAVLNIFNLPSIRLGTLLVVTLILPELIA